MCQLAITPPFNLALRQKNVPAVLYSEIIKALYERRLSRCLLHRPISARPKTGDTEKYDRMKSIQLSSRIYFHSNINLGTITNTSPTNASCASKTTSRRGGVRITSRRSLWLMGVQVEFHRVFFFFFLHPHALLGRYGMYTYKFTLS